MQSEKDQVMNANETLADVDFESMELEARRMRARAMAQAGRNFRAWISAHFRGRRAGAVAHGH